MAEEFAAPASFIIAVIFRQKKKIMMAVIEVGRVDYGNESARKIYSANKNDIINWESKTQIFRKVSLEWMKKTL